MAKKKEKEILPMEEDATMAEPADTELSPMKLETVTVSLDLLERLITGEATSAEKRKLRQEMKDRQVTEEPVSPEPDLPKERPLRHFPRGKKMMTQQRK